MTIEEGMVYSLRGAAFMACKNSYSPYSGFAVGAAVLTEGGFIYSGTNIENASYGATMCAERVAIFKAASDGKRKILALAVTTTAPTLPYPCGMCLQVLSEFAEESIPVYLTGEGVEKSFTFSELLPHRFGE